MFFTNLIILTCFLQYVTSFNQLSFSGGGSFGAVEIGIAKQIAEKEPTKAYDLYTGISAGALNSGFLSYYKDLNTGIKFPKLWGCFKKKLPLGLQKNQARRNMEFLVYLCRRFMTSPIVLRWTSMCLFHHRR